MNTETKVKEIWKFIEGSEKQYSVSNLGRIRSNERFTRNARTGKWSRLIPEKILKQNVCRGYKVIKLSGALGRRDFRVNRLVAMHFIPNPENKPEVNHINEDRFDNRAVNLEWATRVENVNHGTAIQRGVASKSTPIAQLDLNGRYIKIWINAREAARQLGYSNGNIYAALNGKYKQSYGYLWKYI